MLSDRYGLPVSTSSRQALDAYIAGADCLLAATAGVDELLRAAIESDPSFALPHVALARGLFLEGDVKSARETTARARELSQAATAREQSHVNAIALAIEGSPAEALEATRDHLVDYPRDAMVLAPATGVFGLIGFSGRKQREQELHDLLQDLAPHYGADWWFDCVHAFAECECGQLEDASRLIERSMAAHPDNAHGAHVMTHVLHESGATEQSLDFLEKWMSGYDRSGLMHCHLSWHIALAALALGRTDRAWDAYHSAIHPGASWGPALNVVTDAVAFLWRAELAGEPRRPELWTEVLEYALRSFPKAGVTFADVHTAAACAAAGDAATLARMVREMRDRIHAGKLAAGPVVPAIVEGLAAYANGDPDGAIELLELALPDTVRIGGSRAQRDLVEHTLIAALMRVGREDDARRLVGRRVDRRPTVEVAGYLAG